MAAYRLFASDRLDTPLTVTIAIYVWPCTVDSNLQAKTAGDSCLLLPETGTDIRVTGTNNNSSSLPVKARFRQCSLVENPGFRPGFRPTRQGLRPAQDKLRTFRVENLVESVLDLSQHVVIDLARFRPNRGSIMTSAKYSHRMGSRHAFDLSATRSRTSRKSATRFST